MYMYMSAQKCDPSVKQWGQYPIYQGVISVVLGRVSFDSGFERRAYLNPK